MRNTDIQTLIEEFERDIRVVTEHLHRNFDGEARTPALNAWKFGMQRLIEAYAERAALIGKSIRFGRSSALDGMERGRLFIDVLAQFKYLDGMLAKLAGAAEWRRGFMTQALRYAPALQISYFEGLAGSIADLLPVHPGERSDCAMHCACHWEINKLEGRGNYDCRWVVAHDREHCGQCLARAQEWNPLEIRGWRVITPITGAVFN